jgi:O-antigen ligase
MIGTAVTVAGAFAGVLLFYAGLHDPAVNIALSHYGTLPTGNYPRIKSLFANANMMCNYLNVSLGLALIADRLGWLSPTKARLLLSGTWMAALSTLSPGLGGLFLIRGSWASLFASSRITAKLMLAGGVLVAVLGLIVTLVSPSTLTDPSQRTFIWRSTLTAIGDRPLLGRGAGLETVRVEEPTSSGLLVYGKDPHNIWLSVATQSGLIGLIAFACLVLYVCKRVFPLRAAPTEVSVVRTGLGLALLGALLYQGLSGSFEDARHIWVLMGLIVCVDEALADRPISAERLARR